MDRSTARLVPTVAPATPSMRRQAGVTLVELLVTMVIAGIVFAAMVPLFLTAQQVNSMDQMRNIALNLAQDRIEKIRGLNYDDITQDNLQSPGFAGGQFGTTWTAYTGDASRDFSIAYTVTDVGEAAGAYKEVGVTVTWTPPPVVKPIKLQTMISRAYAGPTITNLQLTPLDGDGRIFTSPLTVRATVATGDIATTTKMKFFIYDQAGQEITQADVTSGVNGVYTITWDCSTMQNGLYSFRAQAYANDDVGNTWRRSAELLMDNPPPAPANLMAERGDQLVTLSWDPVVVGDFDHYELWRARPAAARRCIRTTSPPAPSQTADSPTARPTTTRSGRSTPPATRAASRTKRAPRPPQWTTSRRPRPRARSPQQET